MGKSSLVTVLAACAGGFCATAIAAETAPEWARGHKVYLGSNSEVEAALDTFDLRVSPALPGMSSGDPARFPSMVEFKLVLRSKTPQPLKNRINGASLNAGVDPKWAYQKEVLSYYGWCDKGSAALSSIGYYSDGTTQLAFANDDAQPPLLIRLKEYRTPKPGSFAEAALTRACKLTESCVSRAVTTPPFNSVSCKVQ